MVQLRVTRVLALVFAARGPLLACAHQGASESLQQLRDDGHIALDIDAAGSVQAAGTKAGASTRRLTVTSAPLSSFGHGGDSTLERREPAAGAFGGDAVAEVLLKVGAGGDVAQARSTQIRRVSSNPTSGIVPVADRPARRLSIETVPLNSFGHSGDSEHLLEKEAFGSDHEGAMAELRPAGIVRGSESPDGGSTAEVKTRPRSLVIQTVPLNSFGHGGDHEAKHEPPHQYARTASDDSTGRTQGLMVAAAGLCVLALTGAYHSRAVDEKEAVLSTT